MLDKWVKDFTKIWKEDEWLYFELIEEKPKTKMFQVMSKCSNIRLGVIKWYPQWRHYCFFPTIEEETVYSDRCLSSISEFVAELNSKISGNMTGICGNAEDIYKVLANKRNGRNVK
jgi:hypothetical protein